jgi:uncharacterized protein (DUF433 family)
MDRLEEASEMVVEDPEILSGTPVIKGTRIPVHDVAALFDAGTPLDEILMCYPSLKERQVELASVYAQAFPALKRSRRSFADLEHAKVISTEIRYFNMKASQSRKTTS